MRGLLVNCAPHKCSSVRSCQLVADPLNLAIWEAGRVHRIGLRFDNDIEVRWSKAGSADLARRGNGITWLPAEGSGRYFRRIHIGKTRWREAGVVDVAHHLIHAEARLLKRIEHLGFRPIALLRSAEKGKSRADHQEKDTESDEKLD